MNNSITYNELECTFIVSPQILEMIKKLTERVFLLDRNYKQKLTTEFDDNDFIDLIDRIFSRIKEMSKQIIYVGDDYGDKIPFDFTILKSLVQKFEELCPKNITNNYFFNLGENTFLNLLFVINDMDNECKKYYLIRDLINAKNDCVESMKYFLDDTSIANWEKEYNDAAIAKDTNKMKAMITQIQNMILQEWNNYFINLENMNDDNFCFIGHSTITTKFEGEFRGNYISTSVYTPDLTDTFRNGYGFIFAPKNIIAASSRDMYVNNYVDNDKSILSYTSVPKIDHPKKLIDETRKQQEENLTNDIYRKTYNEVVLNAFEPIGIFCFTDGSKQLNENQIRAEKLKENFPNLKIYSFDVLKNKKGKSLNEAKLTLLNKLNNGHYLSESMLDKFDYFFEQFEKLKQSGQYDENMIKVIFENNMKMISAVANDPDKLFNGQYNEDEIKYILRKNSIYSLDDLISGKSKSFKLNRLRELFPYKDKFAGMFKGLDVLVDILQVVDVTDEMMDEINSIKPLSLTTISKTIASKFIDPVKLREEKIKGSLSKYESEYKNLVTEFQQRSLLKEQYKYYHEIYVQSSYYNLLKRDYQDLMEEINKANITKTELELKLQKLESEIEELNQINLVNSEKQYCDTQEHKESEKAREEINMNISNLSKHPLLNRKKIEMGKNIYRYLFDMDLLKQSKFEEEKEKERQNNDEKLRKLNLEIEYLNQKFEMNKEDIEVLNAKLIMMKDKIKIYFKCDTIEQVESKIKESNQFMQQYDSFNNIRLYDLERKIKKLNNEIISQQQLLENVQEQKEIISRGM